MRFLRPVSRLGFSYSCSIFLLVVVVVAWVRWVVDTAGEDRAWPFSLQLIAKLEESDEVGHGPFRVLAVGGDIGEALLQPGYGGFDCGHQPLRREVFRGRKWNGVCIHDWNLAGGVRLGRDGIF